MSTAGSGQLGRSHIAQTLTALPVLVGLLLVWIVGTPSILWSATITAATCSSSAVGTAINNAVAGDTVRIPAGDCTWTSQLMVTKGISLLGAGQGLTIIRDGVAKDGGQNSRLMVFTVNSPNTFRIGNFTLIGQAVDSGNYNKGHIALYGTAKTFRVDHITVNNPQSTFVRTDGDLLGLIDHITMNGNAPVLLAFHANWGGSQYGDGSWAEQLYWGTQKAIYVEDSTITANGNPYTSAALDAVGGARVVFRYNKLSQANTGSHGLDSSQRFRSVRSVEVYNNTFTFPSNMAVDFIHWFRGGTGVMFNNTVNVPGGLNNMAKHSNLRDTGSYSPWGMCNGSSPYDGNVSGQTGYRCVDQPGAGTSRNLNGSPTPIAAANVADPIYVWNNTINGATNNCGVWGCGDDGHVKAGRDIIFGTPRPGYVPYAYPHPLQAGSGTNAPPSAPRNLTAS